MSASRSKQEWVLLIATAGSAMFLSVLVLDASAALGNVWPLLLLGAPFMIVGYLSAFALAKRWRIGAWGALIFFSFQVVQVEREGAHIWPGYHLGFDIIVHQAPGLIVSISVSSIVFAILAIVVIRQYWEQRIIAGLSEVSSLLPPNTSLERTRGR